jgi:hypothetical protein
MNSSDDLLTLARKFHEHLPDRIYEYLNGRGIPDILIDHHLIGWNGWRITIPVFDRAGEMAYFRLAKDPDDLLPGPKMMSAKGSRTELYGWEQVLAAPPRLILCEGEFDRLVLEANGFYAVTSTGGAGVFRKEWAQEFEPIPEVFICFDRDEAGRNGSLRVGQMMPHARIVELPEEVGQGGDITDFFVRLGRSREEFLTLLDAAKLAPSATAASPNAEAGRSFNFPLSQRIERIKREVPIETVIGRSVQLQPSGNRLMGRCPFHEDHTPSFAVYPANGSFYCYGCGKHGDVIGFLREVEHLNFYQALEVLERFTSQDGCNPQQDH